MTITWVCRAFSYLPLIIAAVIFFLSSDTAKSNGCYKWIPSTELMPPHVPVDSLRFYDLLKWNAFQALEYQQMQIKVVSKYAWQCVWVC